MKGKIIRDPIHGFIEISEDALKIISHPLFQRLRYITQTGLSYMVYPGMRHSRFEHSLGVYHLAKDFSRFIKHNSPTPLDFIDEKFSELMGILGLLHDVGHLPFSHIFENALSIAREIYGVNVIDFGKRTHEFIGLWIIENFLSKEIEYIAKNTNISDGIIFLKNVFTEPKSIEEKFGRLLISNFIDADRSDYLLRDSYYAGVEYGWFDIERLKRIINFHENQIVIHYKGLPIVEQFLLARMYMFRNVYFHSVVGMYNAILAHAIADLISNGIIKLPETQEELIEFTDFTIFNKLKYTKKEFKEAILYRRGYKRLKIDISYECLKQLNKNEIIETMKNTKGLIIYHEFQDAPYKENENSAVYILYKGNIVNLSQISPIINSLQILNKGILIYHESMEKEVEKYKEIIQNC
jgi:HD superfamily phosphohydrolase